jgi:hypothetical protein
VVVVSEALPEPDDQDEPSSLDRLSDFVRRIVAVPKHEVDQVERERKEA